MRRRSLAAAAVVALAGCSANATAPATPAARTPSAVPIMTVTQACTLLNGTQADYGMGGSQGRTALQEVSAELASTGMGGKIRAAALGELAHPPGKSETSQYNADWVNDCLLATGTP